MGTRRIRHTPISALREKIRGARRKLTIYETDELELAGGEPFRVGVAKLSPILLATKLAILDHDGDKELELTARQKMEQIAPFIVASTLCHPDTGEQLFDPDNEDDIAVVRGWPLPVITELVAMAASSTAPTEENLSVEKKSTKRTPSRNSRNS